MKATPLAAPARRYRVNGKKDVVFQPALMSPWDLLMGMEWAARQFYALPSIAERMARSRTGLWWNIVRNLGYHLALRNFGDVGFNPEGQAGMTTSKDASLTGAERQTGRAETVGS